MWALLWCPSPSTSPSPACATQRAWGTRDLRYSTTWKESWVAWWEPLQCPLYNTYFCPAQLLGPSAHLPLFHPQLQPLLQNSSIGPFYFGCRLTLLRWEVQSRQCGGLTRSWILTFCTHYPKESWPPVSTLAHIVSLIIKWRILVLFPSQVVRLNFSERSFFWNSLKNQLINHVSFITIKQWFSTRSNLAPRGYLTMSWENFCYHNSMAGLLLVYSEGGWRDC